MLFSRWNVRDESVVGWAPLWHKFQSALLAPTQIVLALPAWNPIHEILFGTYLSNIFELWLHASRLFRPGNLATPSPHRRRRMQTTILSLIWLNITTFLSIWGLGVAQRSWARSTGAEPVDKEKSWRKGRSDRGLAVSQIHTSDSLSWILLHGSS
jgi:hypothetical protein